MRSIRARTSGSGSPKRASPYSRIDFHAQIRLAPSERARLRASSPRVHFHRLRRYVEELKTFRRRRRWSPSDIALPCERNGRSRLAFCGGSAWRAVRQKKLGLQGPDKRNAPRPGRGRPRRQLPPCGASWPVGQWLARGVGTPTAADDRAGELRATRRVPLPVCYLESRRIPFPCHNVWALPCVRVINHKEQHNESSDARKSFDICVCHRSAGRAQYGPIPRLPGLGIDGV
jgi:hypothetical protein